MYVCMGRNFSRGCMVISCIHALLKFKLYIIIMYVTELKYVHREVVGIIECIGENIAYIAPTPIALLQ